MVRKYILFELCLKIPISQKTLFFLLSPKILLKVVLELLLEMLLEGLELSWRSWGRTNYKGGALVWIFSVTDFQASWRSFKGASKELQSSFKL